MSNPIPLIESKFNMELSPGLIEQAGKMSADFYKEFLYEVKKFEGSRDESINSRADGSLRPYFASLDPSVNSSFSGHYGLHEKAFSRNEDIWRFADKLTERLLYCHQVVLDDPLWQHADAISIACENNSEHSFHSRINLFKNYLSFLLYFRPLIESQIILLIGLNTTLICSGRLSRTQFPVEETLNEIGEEKLLKETTTNLQDSNFLADVLVDQAFHHLHAATKMSSQVPGGVDYLLPKKYWEVVFKNYLVSMGGDKSLENKLESLVLQTIFRLELPKLEKLTPLTLVKLRSENENFEHWRSNLRKAMVQIGDTTAFSPSELRILVKDLLMEPKEKLEKESKNSSLVQRINREVSTTMAVGATTHLLMAPLVGDSQATLLSLAATGIQGLVNSLNPVNKPKNVSDALMCHYVALTTD